ncbi:MAG: L-fuculose-phosphate aldolase [Thermodesulfobacteriota bacterium]
MRLRRERSQIVEFGCRLLSAGLTTGSGGNLSLLRRDTGLIAVSPSGLPYPEMTPGDVVLVDLDGRVEEGACRPTSELAFHLAIYHSRPEVNAVVHTHSPWATTVACLGWELPPVHYLVGFAGKKVPLAPYATFGTPELARNTARALGSHQAVLLANHGLVAVGSDLPQAFAVAEEIELVARIYVQAKAAGEPVILPDEEMDRVVEKFRAYGQRGQRGGARAGARPGRAAAGRPRRSGGRG